MALQFLVAEKHGLIFADVFLLIKPAKPEHYIGAIAECFEKGQVFLGYARLEAKNTIKASQISDNLALVIQGQNAPYLRSILASMYPDTIIFDVLSLRWTERNLAAWKVLTECRWDRIVQHTPHTSHYPQLSLHLK